MINQFKLDQFKNFKGYEFEPTDALAPKLDSVLSNVIGIITFISGLAFLFYFFIGAINWITSAGDAEKLKTAQRMILNAIIGLTITAVAYPAIYVISQLLGLNMSSPADVLNQLVF